MKQPNVLLVITHDMSPRLACDGDPYAVTPNLDKLAAKSTRYERHYCQWPLCGPSRTVLMSGLRPQTTRRHANESFWGTLRERMPNGYATLGGAFKNAGYHTEQVWQVLHAYETDEESWTEPTWFPPNPPAPDWAKGKIDADELRYWQTADAFDLIRRRLEKAQARGIDPAKYHRYARGPTVEAADVPDDAYPDGRATDHALHRIATLAKGDKPFFLAVGFEAGHLPWTAPKADFDRYDPSTFILPEPHTPPTGSPPWAMNDQEPAQYYTDTDYDESWAPSETQLREMMHGCYASVTFLDRQVGRLLDALEQADIADETIVVFTSDHGFHVGEHNYVGKHSFWDKSTHCPLIVHVPGRDAAVEPGVTEHVGILPTLCDLAYIDKPIGIEGESFADQPNDAAFSYRRRLPGDSNCYYYDAVSVRTADHRLTIYRDEERQELAAELFDYATDPLESRNVAGELPQVDRDLRHRLAPHLVAFET